jgi:hypothetical protein
MKVIKPRVFPWIFSNGAIIPRGPELWLLLTAPYLLIAWIYSILMLCETMKSYGLKEALFEIKWPFVYWGTTSYVFSLIHATPKTGMNGKETFLPSNKVLNFGYITLTGLCVFPVAFAITSGVYADMGEDEKADWYVRAHYLSWSIACILDTSVLVIFALNLLSMLNENMKNMASTKSSNKSRGSDLDMSGGGTTFTSSNSHSNPAAERMRNAIKTMMITAFGVGTITSMFGVLLGFYAFMRTQMHANVGE